MNSELKNTDEKFHRLSYYTLEQPSENFIHQHAVDAWTLENADETTKTIALVFALAGLCLMLEKNYTGKQVQQFHMLMAKHKKTWPKIELPVKRGDISINDVLASPPGAKRDSVIHQWCESIWHAFYPSHNIISNLVQEYQSA